MIMLAIAFEAIAAGQSYAESGNENPVLIEAQTLINDEASNTLRARGDVEITRDAQNLRADRVIYHKDKQVFEAKGSVALTQPDGQVLFADHMLVTEDLRDAFLVEPSALMANNARFVARQAQRKDGRWLVAQNGVYSVCDLCESDPDKPPVWQIKAKQITQDNETHDVIYRDARLEFGGVPMLYTPYLSHPDPTVKRRQGFLMPSGGYNRDVGSFAKLPYYFDIAPNSDLVLTPTFSSNDKAQADLKWRHRFENAAWSWQGSLAKIDFSDEKGDNKGKRLRGNLFGNAIADINDNWRAGADVRLSSDKSYLRRYRISSEDTLVNRGYIEGFSGRSYAVSNAYYFQDVRPGNYPVEPIVLPDANFQAFGQAGKTMGGRWSLDGGILSITRKDKNSDYEQPGTDTRRLALGAGWQRSWISSVGLVTEVNGTARFDNYWADNVKADYTSASDTIVKNRSQDIIRGRPFAQGDLTMRYPLARRGDGYSQIVEPIAMISAAPEYPSGQRILPNEDSVDVEFDTTNLLATSRFTGIDRLEGGTRVAYGLRHNLSADSGLRANALFGQIWRTSNNNQFTTNSGLENRLSDYVGKLDIIPANWLDAKWGFRMAPYSLSLSQQDAYLSAGVPAFRPFASYLDANQSTANSIELNSKKIQELVMGINSSFAKYWSLSFAHTQALSPSPGPRISTINMNYRDECLIFGITVERDHSTRQDVSAGTSVFFNLYLRTIGGFQSDKLNIGGQQNNR